MANINDEIPTKKDSVIIPIASVVFLALIITVVIFLLSNKKNQNTTSPKLAEEKISDVAEEVREASERNMFPAVERLVPVDETPVVGKAVLADLSLMKISLVEDGRVLEEFPILAKGLEGSRYETPFGKYAVNYKEKNHKVSVRDIYMPFSAQFFGNFFIHGKPIYSSGKELFDGPSGGCIRLSNDVAEKAYGFLEKNTPVFITEDNGQFDNDFITKVGEMGTTSVSLSDQISASSYVVADLKTGVLLAGKNIDETLPIYSLTKLMTATVADETFRDDREIIVDPGINRKEVVDSFVKPGDKMTVTDILYPIVFNHDDLATYSMATNIGSNYYAQLMNQKAAAIGMAGTKFYDPAGLDDKSVSSARDLFILSRYIYFKHPYISKLTLKKSYSISNDGEHGDYNWTNENVAPKEAKLFNQIIKDGSTSSITIMPVTILGENRLISIVILNSKTQNTDEIISIVDRIKSIYTSKEIGLNSEN